MRKRNFERVWLARRGIGYFTEDCRAAGAGCGRKICGALVKCFVSEKGKGKGFLGAFGNAKTRRGQNFDAGKSGGELGKDQRIVRATTGNDELVDLCFGRDETVQGIDDRECGGDCGCADEIVGLGAIASAEGEEFFQIGVAVVFAAGGFWGWELQIGIAQKLVEQRGEAATLGCEAGVLVETQAAVREMRDQGVDQHVGGPGVEGEGLLRFGRARKNCNVGDAAKIERNSAESCVAVEKI